MAEALEMPDMKQVEQSIKSSLLSLNSKNEANFDFSIF